MSTPRPIGGISTSQLVQAWNQGLSGNATLKVLRAEGYTIRTQTFYDQWRAAAGYAKNEWRASLQPQDRAPADEFFSAGSANQYKRYQYTFASERWNSDKMAYDTGVLSVLTDEKVTIAEARELLNEGLTIKKDADSYSDIVRGFAGAWERPENF